MPTAADPCAFEIEDHGVMGKIGGALLHRTGARMAYLPTSTNSKEIQMKLFRTMAARRKHRRTITELKALPHDQLVDMWLGTSKLYLPEYLNSGRESRRSWRD
jgi:hypothetical protein